MRALLFTAVFAAFPDVVHAGRSRFAWLGGTEVLDARSVELQVRTTERNDLGDTRIRETSIWSGLQIGITERLELTLPAEMSWLSAVGLEEDFALHRYGAELRYRFLDRTRCLAPLVRFALLRDVVRRDVVHAELDGTISVTRGRMFVATELGITADVNRGGLFLLLRPGVGASIEIIDDLRVGAELHAELDRESGGTSWLAAGPSVAWTHGRFWFAATYALGFSNISSAPRVVWGAAF